MPTPSIKATSLAAPLRVGVALCSYNGQDYIAQQIDSILQQTRQVDLIVVSDDGSTDHTLACIEAALSQGQVPWRLLRDGRLGITKNFARAVAACEADVIFLCDQDDVWLPTKVERMMRVFEHDAAALLAFSDAQLVGADLEVLGRRQFQMVRMTSQMQVSLQGPAAFPTLLRRNVVTGATVAFRRQLLDDALPFVDGWLHDEWLAIMASLRQGLRCVPEPLVLYRQHGRNQCGMRPEGLFKQLHQASLQKSRTTGQKRLTALQARLEERIACDSVAPCQPQEQLQAAQDFARWQTQLPNSKWLRAAAIAAKWASGAYRRHADGLRSALKDALAVND